MKFAGIMSLLVGMAGILMAGYPGPGTTATVPEIDPGSATTALALISGTVLVILGRKK